LISIENWKTDLSQQQQRKDPFYHFATAGSQKLSKPKGRSLCLRFQEMERSLICGGKRKVCLPGSKVAS